MKVAPAAAVGELVTEWAGESPDRMFLTDAAQQVGISYRQFDDLSARWMALYRSLGVVRGDRVLCMTSTRIEYFASWIGLSGLGAVDVPINPELVGPLLAHAVVGAGARIALIEEKYLARFTPIGGLESMFEKVVVLDGSSELSEPMMDSREVSKFEPALDVYRPQLHDIAGIFFTSGTTGPSKPVVQHWAQLRANCVAPWPWQDLTPADQLYYATPTYHQGAKIMAYLASMAGCGFVFRGRFSTSEWWNDVRRYGCTFTSLVGVMASFLSSQPPSPSDREHRLRFTLMIPVLKDVDAFSARFGVQVGTSYGMTEIPCPFSSTSYEVTNSNAASCGKLVDGVHVRIVDSLDYAVPDGTVGELTLRTDEPWTSAGGYLGMADATARAFQNLWYHTGDAFRRDEQGFYYFVDRLKDTIRRRGENVSSFEVESIVNSHPSVATSAAVAVPSEYNEDEIKICVVLRRDCELTPEELFEFLLRDTPRFMLPRYIEILDELPQTPTQRIRKVVLRERGVTPATWDRESKTAS